MTEETREGMDLSPNPMSEQQAPHFLQDVIFHGKFKVSDSTRYKRCTERQKVMQRYKSTEKNKKNVRLEIYGDISRHA